MNISHKFNGMFHAMLNEILETKKRIIIRNEYNSIEIDLSKISLEQLKILLKMADGDFPKNNYAKIKKNIFHPKKEEEIYNFFGKPLSIKDITSEVLSNHVKWIHQVMYDNDIFLEKDDLSRLINKIDKGMI